MGMAPLAHPLKVGATGAPIVQQVRRRARIASKKTVFPIGFDPKAFFISLLRTVTSVWALAAVSLIRTLHVARKKILEDPCDLVKFQVLPDIEFEQSSYLPKVAFYGLG